MKKFLTVVSTLLCTVFIFGACSSSRAKNDDAEETTIVQTKLSRQDTLETDHTNRLATDADYENTTSKLGNILGNVLGD